MSVSVTINGARRYRQPGGDTMLQVDVSLGTCHQLIPFNEAQLLSLGTAAAMSAYIAKQALAAANAAPCITDLPPGLPDFRGTSVITGALPVAGIGVTTRAVTTAPTLTTSDAVVWVDATSGPLVATLPTAVGNTGQRFEIKKTDSGANTVTVTPAGSEKIDGSLSTRALTLQGETCVITSDGTGWVQTGAAVASVGASAAGIGNVADAPAKTAITALQAALAAQHLATSPA